MHPTGTPAPERRDAAPAATATATATTYRDAGVDLAAAGDAVGRIAALARTTLAAGPAGGPIGHFGGTYRLPAGPEQVLVASADGVGTKLKLAFALGGAAHARVGADLVNHCVNDVLALGARPLFFLDYVAAGRLDPGTLERLVGGMAEACRDNGLALIGGETAEMPGFYAEGEYDVAGFIVGTVAPAALVDGSAVRAGDVLIGLASGGLQTNGYSLARRVLGLTGDHEVDRRLLARPLPGGGGETVGEALLRPHRSFLPAVLPLLGEGLLRGMAHITGGGLLDNLPRMLPAGLAAELDPSAWTTPAIFDLLVEEGGITPAERYRAFNMGIGFVLAVAPEAVDGIQGRLAAGGAAPAVVGRVVPRAGDGAAVRGLVGNSDGGERDA
jgi:phosphoribosylformylglycinamidine cyclo-ligase